MAALAKKVPHYTVLECDRVLQNNVVRVEHEIIEKKCSSVAISCCVMRQIQSDKM